MRLETPADEKRELLRSRITELDTPADPDVGKAWLEESQRRYRELVEGKVKGTLLYVVARAHGSREPG